MHQAAQVRIPLGRNLQNRFIWVTTAGLPLSPTDVPLALSPLRCLTSQSFLPSTRTTLVATAWPRPPSPEWKTSSGSTSPNSSPPAWLLYITRSRPPSRRRPRRRPRLHITSRCHPFLSSPEPDTWINPLLKPRPWGDDTSPGGAPAAAAHVSQQSYVVSPVSVRSGHL